MNKSFEFKELPKFSSKNKDFEFKNENNLRYKKRIGTERWYLICRFQTCNNIAIKEDEKREYCNRHQNGKDNSVKTLSTLVDGLQLNSNQSHRDKCKQVLQIGDDTAEYIEKLLLTISSIKRVKIIGQFGDQTDIIYELHDKPDIWYSLQAKTFSKNSIKGKWTANIKCNYGNDMLIVCCNIERTIFGAILSQYIPKSSWSICLSEQSKYSQYIYTNLQMFKLHLKEMLLTSRIYVEKITDTQEQEKSSLLRLQKACEDEKLEFEYPTKTYGSYDCLINKNRIQCKTTRNKAGKLYRINIGKGGPKYNGKQRYLPYSIDDQFHFFILEITDYPNNFYIIPKVILLEKNLLKSDESKGITKIYLPPLEYTGKSKYDWTLDYINKWELLREK